MDMKARVMMNFSGYGITGSNGDVIDIKDENVFHDLKQAGFVVEVGHAEGEANAKAVARAEARAKSDKK
jgi:hypothetical protein